MVYQINSRQDSLIKKKAELMDESTQRVISSIQMIGAHIEHSSKNNYRPYLMLYGEINAVAFPNGNYQQFLPQTQVHIRYEFSDDEIAELANKGLFYDGFRVPEIISDNPKVEIPMTATAKRYTMLGHTYVTLALTPADIYTTNSEDCGYRFADYFEEQVPSYLETETKEQVEEKDAIPVFEDDESFAEQFAGFEEAEGFDGPEDEVETETESPLSDNARRLLERSAISKHQREIAAGMDVPDKPDDTGIKETEAVEDVSEGESIEDDEEFAAFLQAAGQIDDFSDDTDDDGMPDEASDEDEDAPEFDENPDFGDELGGLFDEDDGNPISDKEIESSIEEIAAKHGPHAPSAPDGKHNSGLGG